MSPKSINIDVESHATSYNIMIDHISARESHNIDLSHLLPLPSHICGYNVSRYMPGFL